MHTLAICDVMTIHTMMVQVLSTVTFSLFRARAIVYSYVSSTAHCCSTLLITALNLEDLFVQEIRRKSNLLMKCRTLCPRRHLPVVEIHQSDYRGANGCGNFFDAGQQACILSSFR